VSDDTTASAYTGLHKTTTAWWAFSVAFFQRPLQVFVVLLANTETADKHD